jgi:hypothetical protein
MNAAHDKNLRTAADLCRAMKREDLAEACSRAANELALLRAERADFHMRYRMDCDADTKRLENELAALRAAYVHAMSKMTQAQSERDEALDALAQAEERIASLQQSLIDERNRRS